MRLKVAVVTESFLPSVNGVTNSVVKVLETYQKLGIEAIVVAPTSPVAQDQEFMGFKVVRSNALPFMQFPVAIPGFFLQYLLEDFEPDVIHVASPFMLGAQALAIANRMGIPTVAVYQTDLAGYTERYGIKFARAAVDRMVAVIHSQATVNLAPTPETKRYLERLGVPNVQLWGRGVDIDLYHPNRRNLATTDLLRADIEAKHNDVVVGFVGRLAAEKRVDQMAQLFGLGEGVKFLIVGDGPERTSLQNQFARYPVHFTGKLSGESLADAYAAIDVFVHFGTEETFGQTIQEAQASGLPVVAPNSGGPRYLIQDGQTGFLVDPHGKGSFRAAVEPLVVNAELRSRVGEGARRAVLRKSWDQNNLELIGIYRSAIESHREAHIRQTRSSELV
ncbi:MAG: glycosyltransferase family 4 protein [Micrococcales bacterium]